MTLTNYVVNETRVAASALAVEHKAHSTTAVHATHISTQVLDVAFLHFRRHSQRRLAGLSLRLDHPVDCITKSVARGRHLGQ